MCYASLSMLNRTEVSPKASSIFQFFFWVSTLQLSVVKMSLSEIFVCCTSFHLWHNTGPGTLGMVGGYLHKFCSRMDFFFFFFFQRLIVYCLEIPKFVVTTNWLQLIGYS